MKIILFFIFHLLIYFSCSKFIEPEKNDAPFIKDYEIVEKEEFLENDIKVWEEFLDEVDMAEEEVELPFDVEFEVSIPDEFEVSIPDEFEVSIPDEFEEEISLGEEFIGDEITEEVEEEKVEKGGFEWPCSLDEECKSKLCVDSSLGKICTISCDGKCPSGYQCKAYKGGLFYCLPIEDGLCLKCSFSKDCPKEKSLCIKMPSGSYCGRECSEEKKCPSGFDCVEVIEADGENLPQPSFQCLPQLEDCACTPELHNAGFICEIANEYGTCTGTIPCKGGEGWGKCSALVPEKELCDEKDNNCNWIIDEGFTIKDWDGKEKKVGEDCGTGACAGGKVICKNSSSALCSTANLAYKTELCGDKKDNNCNGEVDEGCYPKDIDGDGYENEKDCNKFKAEIHPKAKEPCCNGAFVGEEALKKCDYNCDGEISYCSPNDKDLDGYSPPDDCNDNDPKIFPNAPEICDNGIDENCDDNDTLCSQVVDKDGDKFSPPFDCNDNDPEIHPWAMEKCNYIDDNCDGIIDDGNPEGGDKCGSDEGECEAGIFACSHYPLVATLECIDKKDPSEEICDEKDNDCNGKTDEDFPQLGQPCDGEDVDMCENGTYTCTPDGKGIECVNEKLVDIFEKCDGVDNDCDGEIDEDIPCHPADIDGDGFIDEDDCNNYLSEFKPQGKESCCPPSLKGEEAVKKCDKNCDGKIIPCNEKDKDFDGYPPPDDCNDNDPKIYPNAPEKCGNDIDENCDGSDIPCNLIIDKDKDGYSPPFDCNDNNGDIHPFAEEKCNYIDDDCDGIVDNGNPEGGAVCGSDIGECTAGIKVCVHYPTKVEIKCVVVKGPETEKCDYLDNDCDNKTDEDFPKLGQPCDGEDDDLCQFGTFTCKKDGTGVECINETTSFMELCDYFDNDCDGEVDEGMLYEGKKIGEGCEGIGECGVGFVECAPGKKKATCSTNPDGSKSEAKPEICDGLDNNCNGLIDDGLTYFGKPVGSTCKGLGICGIGKVVCSTKTKLPTCSTNPDGTEPENVEEVCDGKDNDCDGHIDNNPPLKTSTCKLSGICSIENVSGQCKKGVWKCNYSNVVGYEEDFEKSCDGIDNDCDGGIDEDFPVGEPCDGDDEDLCKNGTYTCKPDKTGVECINETITDIIEACNNKDDDCDGGIDEDFPVGEPCDGDDKDLCKNGTYTCKPDEGGVECINETIIDLKEFCNNIDDDCDGGIDENFPVGEPCDGPDPDLCKTGEFVCNEDGTDVDCINDTGEATQEVCDGKDNDCNGKTDEGFYYNGLPPKEPCDGIGECGEGVVECLPSKKGATCSTNPDGSNPQNKSEVCDNLDNDCDNETDEGLTFQGLHLGEKCPAIGVCAEGIVVCSPVEKVPTCSTYPNGTNPMNEEEVCDGKDNDCDGKTDEDLPSDMSGCLFKGVCKIELVISECIEGKWTCNYKNISEYEEGEEKSCDGLDNNCDGSVDEKWPAGKPCDGDDEDLCENGIWQCTNDKKDAICIEEIEFKEKCDGVDNDCDGETDEKGAEGCMIFYYDNDDDGFGINDSKCLCSSKKPYSALQKDDCDDNNPNINPGMKDLCNNIDDDCDTIIDKDFPDKDKPCDGPDPDICKNGIFKCKEDGSGLECIGDENKPEICDGKDNDCNGKIDEGFPVGEACDGDDSDKCKNGTYTCKPDGTGVECINETITNIKEICDGEDNDCDGIIDEDLPSGQVGQPCDGDDSDLCKKGTWTCKPDKSDVECINEKVTNIVEKCDNIDNDCDGGIDEDWPKKGEKCDGNDADTCPTGIYLCNLDTNTELVCTKDIACAVGTNCLSSGHPKLPDVCMCGTEYCSIEHGNICTYDEGCNCNRCKCYGNDPCKPPATKCDPVLKKCK